MFNNGGIIKRRLTQNTKGNSLVKLATWKGFFFPPFRTVATTLLHFHTNFNVSFSTAEIKPPKQNITANEHIHSHLPTSLKVWNRRQENSQEIIKLWSPLSHRHGLLFGRKTTDCELPKYATAVCKFYVLFYVSIKYVISLRCGMFSRKNIDFSEPLWFSSKTKGFSGAALAHLGPSNTMMDLRGAAKT